MSCSRLLSITKEKGQDGLVTLQQSPLYSFMYALKSSEANRQYPKRLKMLFDYLKLQGILEEQAQHLLDNTEKKGVQWAQDTIMIFLNFHKERVRKKLAAGTLKNYYRAAKLFCEMNDLTISWKPVEYPDRRIKLIVYSMASGGFRLGAWDYLQWKHVFPINNENTKDEVIAAKLS